MLDQCPHRLAPLSEGRILPNTGDIECPYHGWSFEGKTGNCTGIPQLPANATLSPPQQSARSCATSLPCVERQGILWVHTERLYNPATAHQPDARDVERYLVEPIDQKGVLHVDYMRDLPMEWSTLAENVMDPSHLPFTHHGTIGRRGAAGPFPLQLVRPPDENGIVAVRQTDPPGSVEFRAPHLIYSGTFRNESFADWNVAYAIPTVPGSCRLLVRIVFEVGKMKAPLRWVFATLFRGPAWMLHLNNHKILEDDNIFLHHQMHHYRALEDHWQDETYLPTDSDRVVLAFRQKWLPKYGMQDRMWTRHTREGAYADGSRMLSRDALLERGTTHTELCTSCSKAKTWLDRIEPVFGVSAVVCLIRAIGGTRVQWVPGLLAVFTYMGKLKISRMRRSMEIGDWPPPRNRC